MEHEVESMSVKIITDSTAYLPEDYLAQYDIDVVSLNVVMDGQSRREMELSNDTFYEEMARAKEIPKSAQPSMDELTAAFERAAENGQDVLAIFLSSKLSGTATSAGPLAAKMVMDKYPQCRIEVFDSLNTGMPMGFLAIEAAKAAQAGQSLEEVLQVALEARDKIHFVFCPDTLDYLRKGGRIGGASALLGNLLQIKPILTVKEGAVIVLDKVRSQKKAIASIIDIMLNDVKNSAGLGDIIVHHINCPEDGRKLADSLQTTLDHPVRIQSIGPIVGIHVGPGSIGIAYILK